MSFATVVTAPSLFPAGEKGTQRNAGLTTNMVANCTMSGSCGGEPAGTAPPVLVSVALYGPASFGYVCIHPTGSTCQYKLRSLDAVVMNTSGTYTIQAVLGNPSAYQFDEWLSNAGTFGNRTAVQTTFTPGSGGWLTFVMSQLSPITWAGYTAAMIGNNSAQMVATYARGTFTVPTPTFVGCNNLACDFPGTEVTGIWVGLGDGLGSGHIWQAGVDVDITPTLSGADTIQVSPWYEAWPSNPVYLTNSLHVAVGDRLRVTVWANGATSNYDIYDLTTGAFTSGSIGGAPPSDSAEWVVEDELRNGQRVVMANTTQITFTNPTAVVTCGGTSCSGLGTSTWLLPLVQNVIAEANQISPGQYVTQYEFPSLIYSNMTEFTETYEST